MCNCYIEQKNMYLISTKKDLILKVCNFFKANAHIVTVIKIEMHFVFYCWYDEI